ncbi:MAG: hypothetical protein Q8R51_03340 [Azonexus sp.]|nr:hypothetical protein [Azonexus sp.]
MAKLIVSLIQLALPLKSQPEQTPSFRRFNNRLSLTAPGREEKEANQQQAQYNTKPDKPTRFPEYRRCHSRPLIYRNFNHTRHLFVGATPPPTPYCSGIS